MSDVTAAVERAMEQGPSERWTREDVDAVASELGVELDGVDLSDVVSEAAFIQSAIKRPGQLHRDLGVPQNETIPEGKLRAAAKRKDKVGMRARLAIKLKGMRRRKAQEAEHDASNATVRDVVEASFGGMVKCPECGVLNVKSAKRCKNCGHDMGEVTAKAKADGRSSVKEAALGVLEAADSLRKASTPEPFSRSRTSNWVARAGGLPPYIQHIAHDLVEKRGKTVSNAIQMAIGIVKNWASGKGNVDANTRAAAAKAVAQWEAMKAKNRAKSVAEAVLEAVLEAVWSEADAEPSAEDFAVAAAVRVPEDS